MLLFCSKLFFKTLLQYLNGCNRYFATDISDQMIPTDYKSQTHKTKGCLKDSFLDDYFGFQNLDRAMNAIGVIENEKSKFFEAIAGILHLGNVEFEKDVQGCKVSDRSEKSLEFAASLLDIRTSELRELLIFKIIVVRNMHITYVDQFYFPYA